MSRFRDRYETDKTAENEGVWVDYGDGIQVKIRRVNCARSREYRRTLEKPYAKMMRSGDLPDSLSEELLNKQIAGVLVVDWKGVEDPRAPAPAEGEKPTMLPFSQENVMFMITEYPDFREDILAASMEKATYQKAALKEAEGN